MQASVERKWIIKSENKILGPYSFEQIEDLIKKKQITLIDEVRDMHSRWTYIRETKDLLPIVENIRTELASNEDMTKTIQTKTAQTGTMTKTEELSSIERTPPGGVAVAGFDESILTESSATTNIQDVEFKETELKSEVKNEGLKLVPNKQYVFEHDPKVKTKLLQKNKYIFAATALVLIIIMASGFGYHFYRLNVQKKYELSLLAQIKKFNLYGLDGKVIEVFGLLNSDLQKQIIPDIIPLIPKLDAAGLINGPKLISELRVDTRLSDAKKAIIDIIEFQQALQDQNLKSAHESIIRAKDLDPTSDFIKENEAILNMIEKKYDKTAVAFLDIFKRQEKGRHLFAYAISQALNPEITTDDIIKTITEIDRFLAVRVDFKKELLLVNMFLNKKISKDNDFMINYKNFIDTPIGLRKQFQIPFSIYAPFYNIDAAQDVFEKLKSYLTLDQKFMIETHYKLELGELSSAMNLINTYQNLIQTKENKINLQIQIDFANKNYESILAFEKTLIPDVNLNTASELAILLSKKYTNKPVSEMAKQVRFFQNTKNILSLWAQLIAIDQKNAQVSFVQMNSVLNDDFIPYQEVKGSVE